MADEDNAQKKKSRKPSKKLLYFLIILIVILAEGFVLCYDYATNEDSLLQDLSEDYPILNQVLRSPPLQPAQRYGSPAGQLPAYYLPAAAAAQA